MKKAERAIWMALCELEVPEGPDEYVYNLCCWCRYCDGHDDEQYCEHPKWVNYNGPAPGQEWADCREFEPFRSFERTVSQWGEAWRLRKFDAVWELIDALHSHPAVEAPGPAGEGG